MLNITTKKSCLVFASSIEEWLNDFGIECECQEASNLINLYYQFKPVCHISKTKLEKIKNGLSLRLEVPAEHINIEMKAGRISLSLPLEETPVIAFNELHNKDRILRGNKLKTDFLKCPVALTPNNELVYIDFSQAENIQIIGSTRAGKTNAMFYLITSLLLRSQGTKATFILLDAFKRHFRVFSKLNCVKIGNTLNEVAKLLDWTLEEIDFRYNFPNNKKVFHYPIFIFIDELLQHIEAKKEFATKLQAIASTGLECNIFLVVANQKLNQSIIKANNFLNNLLTKIVFRIDKLGNMLYGVPAETLATAGACFINKQRSQFGYLSEKERNGIIKYLLNRQTKKQPQEQKPKVINSNVSSEEKRLISNNTFDFEGIKASIPEPVIKFLISKCFESSLVSAKRMQKYLRCGMQTAVNYCKELEHIKIIRNLGQSRGRILTEKGKEFLTQYINNEPVQNETETDKVIPLFEK